MQIIHFAAYPLASGGHPEHLSHEHDELLQTLVTRLGISLVGMSA
jgi:hypothetical protein